ncbi:transcriptional regulator [Carnobacterium divergens]|uniref:ArsR/SmtB family transcription factor n=1 Tax=Carnobacterium divergens TaxID=2748 RepID=UPI000D4F858C|nr:metalloregulator ArsR/SmtB family transcription factor [Carnobacterium divergens]MCO6018543.1 metalloregulator ArsR/SmtB family transcription factor [Carnobacterium divergens]TFI65138.1 transcriptional regulator [Carnobacterium divergens]TFI92028.1 transcriptional regulator [Carnobacterium divergens]TFJ07250.1 transcriptional regulator [Carnobacterium divergens]TFJ08481.1 transcriptional regulator [Carnobacterium divergens]
MTFENKKLTDQTIQRVSQIFKVLSDPTRISILYLLEKQELNVGAIAQCLGMEQSAVSHQLRTLRTANLVKSRRDGKTIYYSQDDEHVLDLLTQAVKHTKHIQ